MKTTTKKEAIKVFEITIDQYDYKPYEKDFNTKKEYQAEYDKWQEEWGWHPEDEFRYLVGAENEEEAILFVKKEIEPVELKVDEDHTLDIRIKKKLKAKKKGILG